MREKLIELLNKYFNVGDSDFYVCNRVKEAFTLGTMSLDDFSEMNKENTSDIADYLLENGVSDIKDCEKCKHFKISPAQYPCSHCRNCYTDKFELMDGGIKES